MKQNCKRISNSKQTWSPRNLKCPVQNPSKQANKNMPINMMYSKFEILGSLQGWTWAANFEFHAEISKRKLKFSSCMSWTLSCMEWTTSCMDCTLSCINGRQAVQSFRFHNNSLFTLSWPNFSGLEYMFIWYDIYIYWLAHSDMCIFFSIAWSPKDEEKMPDSIQDHHQVRQIRGLKTGAVEIRAGDLTSSA